MTRISFLFVEMDFPGGRGSSGKIVEFPGGGGVRPDPLERKIQGGGGSNWKNPPWGGMDIFWNHTFECSSSSYLNETSLMSIECIVFYHQSLLCYIF